MIQDALRKISIQIKHGRLVDAEKALFRLLDSPVPEDRAAALPVYVDMQMQAREYADAARLIADGLQLPLNEEIARVLKEKLLICESEINRKPIQLNYENPEFIEFLLGIPKYLQSSQCHAKSPFVELTDPCQVEQCAHDQNISIPFFAWNVVRASASKIIFDYCFENKIDLTKFDSDYVPRIAERCASLITEQHPGFYYYDDVEADLIMIARALLVGKRVDVLLKMKIAYEAKLFPCGWRGEFPKGDLLVFRLW